MRAIAPKHSNDFSGKAAVHIFTSTDMSQLSVGIFCVDRTDKQFETVDSTRTLVTFKSLTSSLISMFVYRLIFFRLCILI